MARTLGVWFHRAFGRDPDFRPGPFVPPPDPAQASRELHRRARAAAPQVVDQQAAGRAGRAGRPAGPLASRPAGRRAPPQAEAEARRAYDDLAAALVAGRGDRGPPRQPSGPSSSSSSRRSRLSPLRPPAAAVEAVVEQAQQAASLLDLDEAATRRLIDAAAPRRRLGGRHRGRSPTRRASAPRRGRTSPSPSGPPTSGPADYVLFVGPQPVAVVEAKRATRTCPASIEQAKRYSRGTPPHGDETHAGRAVGRATRSRSSSRPTAGRSCGSSATKSGIWFLDARRPTNHPAPLEGWYTPDGLLELLKQDVDGRRRAARGRAAPTTCDCATTSSPPSAPSRAALAEGRRELLVAMATGTGKTRTCIGLIYRLLKAKRFRRVLFLVDRNALGEQTADAFKEVRLENLQTFTDIFDVKELGDIKPDADTRLHIATIQGMVKRVLFADDGERRPAGRPVRLHRRRRVPPRLPARPRADRGRADLPRRGRLHLEVPPRARPLRRGEDRPDRHAGAAHRPRSSARRSSSTRYREAVIDGYLVDHEPPDPDRHQARRGRHHTGRRARRSHALPAVHRQRSTRSRLPDEVDFDDREFNRASSPRTSTASCARELAEHIDPGLPGKTLIFCVDRRARRPGGAACSRRRSRTSTAPSTTTRSLKITGAADKPLEAHPPLQERAAAQHRRHRRPADHRHRRARRSRTSCSCAASAAASSTSRCSAGRRGCARASARSVFRIFDAVDLYAALERTRP